MSTRGIVGFIVDGQEKLAYNHFDSYPSGIGVQVLTWLISTAMDRDTLGLEGARLRATQLQVVNDDTPITAEAIEKCRPFTDASVGARVVDGKIDESLNWYQMLRNTQGDLGAILEAGYLEDAGNFPLDSLFCEWGYVIDFDRNVFEVYRGFQESSPTGGRWAGRPTAEEYAEDYAHHVNWCKDNGRQPWMTPEPKHHAINLVASFRLDDLPTEQVFLALTEDAEETVE